MNRYVFDMSNKPYKEIIVTIAVLGWCFYIFKGKFIIGYFIFSLLVVCQFIGTIKELCFFEDSIVVKNICNMHFKINFDDITYFGKGWGNYRFFVRKKRFPLSFSTRVGHRSLVPDILSRLETVTGRKSGVIFQKKN